jgi:hypothetical protein
MKVLPIIVAAISLVVGGVFLGFSDVLESPQGAESVTASQTPYFEPTATTDTIQGLENDTITISSTLVSLWAYNHTIATTAIIDTMRVIGILQENNSRTGGTWHELERDTINGGTSGFIRLHGGATSANTTLGWVQGVRQRVIIDGYASAGDTTLYTLKSTYKKQ